jgi:hypothetical protein
MDVLALPYGRNLDAWDELESDFLGLVFGEFVGIQVVVVRDGDATEPLAFAERKEFFDRKVAVRKLGVHVEIRIPAVFCDEGGITPLHYCTP